MQNHPVDEINASKTYRYKIDFVLDDVIPIARTVAISRESNKNTGGKKIRGKCGEERWKDEGKKSKGESMKTKSNHNDGNLCG